MIVTKRHTTRADGVKLVRTYSDQGLRIRKVGTEEVYDEAIDVKDAGFEYEETETPIGSEV